MSRISQGLATAAAACVLALAAQPSAAFLISVDFGAGQSATFSGNEAVATAVNSGFGAASVWNGLQLVDYYQEPQTGARFANLIDNLGAPTGVGLSLMGSVKAFSGFNNSSPDVLRKDYVFFNSSNNPARSLSWSIDGLTAGAMYDLFLYGGNANPFGDWTMGVDGAGVQVVAGMSGTAYFANLTADSNGTIGGNLFPSGPPSPLSEVNWSGFQLLSAASESVPAPGTLVLLVGSLVALRRAARRPGPRDERAIASARKD